MKVILDANVIVAAFASRGLCESIEALSKSSSFRKKKSIRSLVSLEKMLIF